MKLRPFGCVVFIFLLVSVSTAQVASSADQPANRRPTNSPTTEAAAAPGAPSIPIAVADLNPLLNELDEISQASAIDIARLRIEKWKADSSYRQQSQENAQSLQRNIRSALPGMVASVRSQPDNLAAGLKLYRNLNALYDVMSALTESAGAFGPKSDFEALASQLSGLDNIRRAFADRLEALAAAKDSELLRLRAQPRPAPPPKKIIVDENEPSKKPAKKKKPAPKTPAPQ